MTDKDVANKTEDQFKAEVDNFKETKELKNAFSKVLTSTGNDVESEKVDTYINAFKKDVNELQDLPYNQEVYILIPSEVIMDTEGPAFEDASKLLKIAGNISRNAEFKANASVGAYDDNFTEVVFSFPNYEAIEQVKNKFS